MVLLAVITGSDSLPAFIGRCGFIKVDNHSSLLFADMINHMLLVLLLRQREEMLCQLKVTLSPSESEKAKDSPWILVDSDGEEVFTFPYQIFYSGKEFCNLLNSLFQGLLCCL